MLPAVSEVGEADQALPFQCNITPPDWSPPSAQALSGALAHKPTKL